MAAVVFGLLIPWGANTAFLSAVASVAYIATALVVIALVPAPSGFWWRISIPVLLLILAAAWASKGLAPGTPQDWTAPFRQAANSSLRSTVPDVTLLELCKLLGVGAIALAGTLIGSDARRLKTCAWIMLSVGAAYTLFALLLHQHDPFAVFGVSKATHEGRFTGTLLNPNTAGCLFGMLGALAGGFVRSEVTRITTAPSAYRMTRLPQLSVLVLGLFFFVAACALTQSRASLACAFIAIVVLALPRQGPAHRLKFLGLRISWSWLLVATVVVGVILAGAGALQRAGDFGASANDRLQAYALFRDQALQAPWFGYGLGGFNAVALHVVDAAHAEAMWNFRSAHNALLQAALEGGAPYLFLLLAALVAWFTLGVGAPPQAGLRSVRLGLLAGAAIAVGCAMVDIALNVPSLAGLAALFAGLYLGAGYRSAPQKPVAGRAPSPGAVAAPGFRTTAE